MMSDRDSLEKTSYSALIIKSELGRGGFGKVYRAEHKQWGTVAFKQIMDRPRMEAGSEDKRLLETLEKEFSIHKTLQHPRVVIAIGIVADPGKCGILLQYQKYGSLDKFLTNYQVSVFWKLHMIYDIAVGMCYLHSKRIIHGDLKILNVLVGEGYKACISDFGSSTLRKLTTELKLDNNMHKSCQYGTITHCAPERLANIQMSPNEKTDVYSFGILMWEILTAKVPFEGVQDPVMISVAVRDGQRPDINEIKKITELIESTGETIVEMIQICCSQSPDARPMFEEMKNTLSQLNKTFENKIEDARENLQEQERRFRKSSSDISGKFVGNPADSCSHASGVNCNVFSNVTTGDVPQQCASIDTLYPIDRRQSNGSISDATNIQLEYNAQKSKDPEYGRNCHTMPLINGNMLNKVCAPSTCCLDVCRTSRLNGNGDQNNCHQECGESEKEAVVCGPPHCNTGIAIPCSCSTDSNFPIQRRDTERMTSDVANIQLEYNLRKASLPSNEHSDDNNNRARSDDIQERHGSKSNASSESVNVGSSSVEKRRPKSATCKDEDNQGVSIGTVSRSSIAPGIVRDLASRFSQKK